MGQAVALHARGMRHTMKQAVDSATVLANLGVRQHQRSAFTLAAQVLGEQTNSMASAVASFVHELAGR